VDDTDWGGPETVTLTDPPPGSHVYWVHDYSGPPATLGTSDVVVRVVIGEQEAGEFRILRGVTQRSSSPAQRCHGRQGWSWMPAAKPEPAVFSSRWLTSSRRAVRSATRSAPTAGQSAPI